jgi:hypothetical protein
VIFPAYFHPPASAEGRAKMLAAPLANIRMKDGIGFRCQHAVMTNHTFRIFKKWFGDRIGPVIFEKWLLCFLIGGLPNHA